ncbi:MAG: carboxylesterase/lipase family protein [Lachnospiraceae bacterium]|nr:carboxylesterase/lipase family protein [Lachnospiraceae bacterium]
MEFALNAKKKLRRSMTVAYGENRILLTAPDPDLSAVCVNGIFAGRRTGCVLCFRGIPYALPPVGKRRWKRPVPVRPSGSFREAVYNGRSPVQTELESERASFYPQGEDCLYLNVWTCADRKASGKPVMVFFHGGSYGWGGTADPLYDGTNFVAAHQDIVLITVGYRTGLMGFVDLSYVPGGEDWPDAPNLGLLDQIEALRWVRENAAAFGGDPDNVTIFGESAGGGSVSLLPVIDEARGLFHRIIAQSGSVALTYSKEECRGFTERLLKVSGAKCMADLMSLSGARLSGINRSLNDYNNFPQRDGRLIPLNPYVPYENGLTSDVDMLIGTNANELNYWIGELGGIVPFRLGMPVRFENDMRIFTDRDKKLVRAFLQARGGGIWGITELYNDLMFRLPAIRQAYAHSGAGGRAYMYYWRVPSAIKHYGACHAVELSYVFGNTEDTVYTGKPADKKLSAFIGDCWANFARCGDPSAGDLVWKPYSTSRRETLMVTDNPYIASDPLRGQRRLLMPLTRYMLNASYAELDYNVPSVRTKIGAVTGLATAGILLALSGKKDD